MGDKKSLRSSANLGTYSSINSIMQKFRPIAPKPAAVGSGEANIPIGIFPEKTRTGSRVKRKYQLRVRRQRRCKKKNNSTSESTIETELGKKDGSSSARDHHDQVVTLQLLPERSDDDDDDGNDSPKTVPWCSTASGCSKIHDLPTLIKCNNLKIDHESLCDFNRSGFISMMQRKNRVVETWIVVECVTETCMDGVDNYLGVSDTDKINYLQVDMSPGFVSDGSNNVVWVNEAYKKMVSQEIEEHHEGSTLMEFKMWLMLKENVPFWYPTFACRTTHHYMRRGQKCSTTVPCDVWRMNFGGFAWKLDTRAALGLAI